jgi:hypothetical protein
LRWALPVNIPKGIEFGRKVIQIPILSKQFEYPLWVQGCTRNPISLIDSYCWIDRGSIFAKVAAYSDSIDNDFIKFFYRGFRREVPLKSPVSGLVLNSFYFFGNEDSEHAAIYILIPNDEPEPEGGGYIFGEVCDFFWDHRESIFLKPSKLKQKFSEDSLRKILDDQKSQVCNTLDALPRFKDHLDEARKKHYDLRPYLRHLH